MLKLCANSADSTIALYIGTPKSLLNFIISHLTCLNDKVFRLCPHRHLGRLPSNDTYVSVAMTLRPSQYPLPPVPLAK